MMEARSAWRRRISTIAAGTLLFASTSLTSSAAVPTLVWSRVVDGTATVGNAFDGVTGADVTARITVTQNGNGAKDRVRCVKVVSSNPGVVMTPSSSVTENWILSSAGADVYVRSNSPSTEVGNGNSLALTVMFTAGAPSTGTILTATAFENNDCSGSSTTASQTWTFVAVPEVDGCINGDLYVRSQFQDECDLQVAAISITTAQTVTVTRNIDVRPEKQDRFVRFAPEVGSSACLTLPEPVAYSGADRTVDIVIGGAGCDPRTSQPLRFTMLVYKVGDTTGGGDVEKQRTFVISDVTVTSVGGPPDPPDPEDPEDPQDPQDPQDPDAISMSCSPAPQVGVMVTCAIAGGPVGLGITWEASYNPVFSAGSVTLDGSGGGTMSFMIPAAAMGSMVGIRIVDHTDVMPLGMVPMAVPVSISAGEGSHPMAPMRSFLMLGGLVTMVVVSRRLLTQG